MKSDYEEMLEKAIKDMPDSVMQRERFEIPKILGHLQGNKTIISNFPQIANTLRRPQEHLLKYLLKELATPGDMKNNFLLLGAKVPASRINGKIRQYAIEFVLCVDCGKPDTKIEKEGNFSFIKCMACGTKHPIKSRI